MSNYHITSPESKIELAVDFGQLKSVMDWCRTNCNGRWGIQDLTAGENDDNKTTWIFEFEDERDHLIFSLRWK